MHDHNFFVYLSGLIFNYYLEQERQSSNDKIAGFLNERYQIYSSTV